MSANHASGGVRSRAGRSHGQRHSRLCRGAAPRFLRSRPAVLTANSTYAVIAVQAVCQSAYGMQLLLPSGQVAMDVFQNLMVSK